MKKTLLAAAFAASGCFVAGPGAFAQVGFPPPPPKVSPAAGVIDMHVHPDPDVFGRALTDVEMATVARRQGHAGPGAQESRRHHRRPRGPRHAGGPGHRNLGRHRAEQCGRRHQPGGGRMDAPHVRRPRQGGVAADVRFGQARQDAGEQGRRGHSRGARREGHAADGGSAQDHRAREPAARDRPRARRRGRRGHPAREGTGREEHHRHPRPDEHSRPHDGAGERRSCRWAR